VANARHAFITDISDERSIAALAGSYAEGQLSEEKGSVGSVM
jgi:hypothetical protein